MPVNNKIDWKTNQTPALKKTASRNGLQVSARRCFTLPSRLVKRLERDLDPILPGRAIHEFVFSHIFLQKPKLSLGPYTESFLAKVLLTFF